MSFAYPFFDFIAYSGIVALAFYWGYAGNLILNKEHRVWVKILLFGAMFAGPFITPLFIYAFYFEPVNTRLRKILGVKGT